MVVDVTVAGRPSAHEDRLVLVAGDSEAEARAKGDREAREYEQHYLNSEAETVTWKVRGIADVAQVFDAELRNGTELYSAFIDSEQAEFLMTGGDSPLQAWMRANPGRDFGEATVEEALGSWDRLHDPEEGRS